MAESKNNEIYKQAGAVITEALERAADGDDIAITSLAEKAVQASRMSKLARSFSKPAKTGKFAGIATPGATKPKQADKWIHRAQIVSKDKWSKALTALGWARKGSSVSIVKVDDNGLAETAAKEKAPEGFEPTGMAVVFVNKEAEGDLYINPKIIILGEYGGEPHILVGAVTVESEKFMKVITSASKKKGRKAKKEEAEDGPEVMWL